MKPDFWFTIQSGSAKCILNCALMEFLKNISKRFNNGYDSLEILKLILYSFCALTFEFPHAVKKRFNLDLETNCSSLLYFNLHLLASIKICIFVL